MFENTDFSPGKVTYLEFDIDPTLPLNEQDDDLTEDILQVVYPNNLLIDVGWHSNAFVVCIIKKCNWEKPIIRKKCKTLKKLEESVKECICKVRKIIEKEDEKNLYNIKMFGDMDFSPGKILYLDFYFNPKLSFSENSHSWSEDLIHVDYPNSFILHVGWYFNQFVVDIIKGYQWEKPFIRKKCKTLEELEKTIKECIFKVRETKE